MATRRLEGAFHNRALRTDIEGATALLERTLRRMTPVLAPYVASWMRKLSGTSKPQDYFLHPEAFPMFLLPYWVERATGARPARQLRRDLTYSTLNGYYFIRLMDDVMDRDGDVNPLLMPALNVFHLEYVRPYTAHFPPDHLFWRFMRKSWFRSAEAATHDAILRDMTTAQFKEVAAQKVCAVKIPMAAVCHYYDRRDLMRDWTGLVDVLGCWHQMLNDLFDWRKDLQHENDTYFLSEARRRARSEETAAEWVIREGFQWGIGLLDDWMQEMQRTAARLHSPGLSTYLCTRRAFLAQRVSEMSAPVRAMQQLVAAMRSKV